MLVFERGKEKPSMIRLEGKGVSGIEVHGLIWVLKLAAWVPAIYNTYYLMLRLRESAVITVLIMGNGGGLQGEHDKFR